MNHLLCLLILEKKYFHTKKVTNAVIQQNKMSELPNYLVKGTSTVKNIILKQNILYTDRLPNRKSLPSVT